MGDDFGTAGIPAGKGYWRTMKADYHMHFEKGSYDKEWVEGFFKAARERGLEEIGISEHSHTFPEFRELYYEDLILDDSFVGSFQQKWLQSNKF